MRRSIFVFAILLLNINYALSTVVIETNRGTFEGDPEVGMMAAKKFDYSCKKSIFVWVVGTIIGIRPGKNFSFRKKLKFKDCFLIRASNSKCIGPTHDSERQFTDTAEDILFYVMTNKFYMAKMKHNVSLVMPRIEPLKSCDENMTDGIDTSSMDHYFHKTK